MKRRGKSAGLPASKDAGSQDLGDPGSGDGRRNESGDVEKEKEKEQQQQQQQQQQQLELKDDSKTAVAVASAVNDDEYEDVYVVTSIPNFEEQSILLNAKSVELEDMLGKHPTVIVDNTFHFAGTYEMVLGTKLLFSDKDSEYIGSASKRLKLELVKLETHDKKTA
jgi:hypothetical protein